MNRQLLDGAWVDAIDGGTWDVIDPATEEVIERVPFGGAADVNRAIESAHRALPAWRARTAYERGAILTAAAGLVRARVEALAGVTTRESGKPAPEAAGEWQVVANLLEFYAEEGKRAYGYTIPARAPNRRMIVLREPIGVVGVITAWNCPAYNPARAVAAALGAGCTVVVRPSELTPLSAMALAAVLVEAGVPAGVLGLVNGDPAAMGQAMLDHPDLKKISFTGSVPVGKLLMDGASRTMTRLSLELGGNAPVIVLPDADLEAVAKGAVGAKLRNAGQVCVSPQRFLVERSRLAAFEEAAVAVARTRTIGPMISARHRERVEALVGAAVGAGARVLTGGQRRAGKGFFYEPTVLGGVTPEMSVFTDENFGPVFHTSGFDSLEEAVRRANDTPYGLAAYVFTRDLASAIYAYEHLDFGMIGVNEWAPQAVEAPFVGRKASGLGHEGGAEGLLDNLETKLVSIGGL